MTSHRSRRPNETALRQVWKPALLHESLPIPNTTDVGRLSTADSVSGSRQVWKFVLPHFHQISAS
jgi:hypothetical protein